MINGMWVEIYSKRKGWYFSKKNKGHTNPVACLRDFLIRTGNYDKSNDKTVGEFYLWCENKITGVVV
jgi:hypothetical protein